MGRKPKAQKPQLELPLKMEEKNDELEQEYMRFVEAELKKLETPEVVFAVRERLGLEEVTLDISGLDMMELNLIEEPFKDVKTRKERKPRKEPKTPRQPKTPKVVKEVTREYIVDTSLNNIQCESVSIASTPVNVMEVYEGITFVITNMRQELKQMGSCLAEIKKILADSLYK